MQVRRCRWGNAGAMPQPSPPLVASEPLMVAQPSHRGLTPVPPAGEAFWLHAPAGQKGLRGAGEDGVAVCAAFIQDFEGTTCEVISLMGQAKEHPNTTCF